MFHMMLLSYVFIAGISVSSQAEVQAQTAQLRTRSPEEDAARRIRELAEKIEETISVGFGDGQHGRRLSSSAKPPSDSSKVPQQRISDRLRHKDRAVLLEDLKEWAGEMKKEADRLQEMARQSGDSKKQRSGRKLQQAILQLQKDIERLPEKQSEKPDAKLLKKIETSLAKIPAHTPEWTNLNDSDPGS